MASSLVKLISDASRKCLSIPQGVTGVIQSTPLTGAHPASNSGRMTPPSPRGSAAFATLVTTDRRKITDDVIDSRAPSIDVSTSLRGLSNFSSGSHQLLQPQQQQQPHLLLHHRLFSTSSSLSMQRFNRRRMMQETERSKDDGTRGELSMTQAQELPALELKLSEAAAQNSEAEGEDGAAMRQRRTALDWMPRPEDYETVYENGKKFKELPIVFLNADKNNTKLGMTDARQMAKAYTSAGIEGFKGCKRGTNIAAQTSAMSFAKRLVRQSKVTHVRVVVKGLGPGRLSAIEGLVMGGLNVVSITDDTPVFGLDPGQGPGPRPRKVRRV